MEYFYYINRLLYEIEDTNDIVIKEYVENNEGPYGLNCEAIYNKKCNKNCNNNNINNFNKLLELHLKDCYISN
jgi:hypothetical protein